MIAIGLLFVRIAVRLLQAAAAAGSRNPDTAASTQRPAAANAAPATAFALGRPRPVHLALSSLPAHSKNIFGAFFRNTPATIMRCGRTFRLARTHPVRVRSSGSETLSRSRSLADYTIDMHESEFSEATGHDAAMPPSSVMNSRRLIRLPRLPPPAACLAR